MKIKDQEARVPLASLVRPTGGKRELVLWLLLPLSLVTAFLAGIHVQEEELVAQYMNKAKISKDRNFLPSIWYSMDKKKAIGNWLATPTRKRPEAIRIHIKQKHFQTLKYKQLVATQSPVLLTSSEDFVPAEVEYKGKTMGCDIRLKGDWTEHIRGNKWSFRVKLDGDSTLHGTRIFSLHAPIHRNYLHEWLFLKAAKDEGLIALRYHFHEVFINGEPYGIYAFEEHFTKRLVENNQRREGPILKFDESDFWRQFADLGGQEHLAFYWGKRSHMDFQASQVDSFRTKRLMSSEEGRAAFAKAATLLDRFRSGDIKASEAFDAGQMGKYFALIDLFGAWHAARWHNIRFYLNPISGKLEPIPFDGMGGRMAQLSCVSTSGFFKLFFQDPALFREYVANLEKVSKESYLQGLTGKFSGKLASNEKYIQLDEPGYSFDWAVLERNAQLIREALQPHTPLRILLHQEKGSPAVARVANTHAFPIEVHSVHNGGTALNLDSPIHLPASTTGIHLEFVDIELPGEILPGTPWEDVRIGCRIAGGNLLMEKPVNGLWHREDSLIGDPVRKKPNVGDYPGIFTVDPDARTITVTGSGVLREMVVLPQGFTVRCEGSQEIDLRDGASLISYSPWDMVLPEGETLKIHSQDNTGEGVALLDARGQSQLQGVSFENLSNPSVPGWSLTGAVTFYKSPVVLTGCHFSGNRCEDALNIFDAPFTLDRVTMEDTFADGFDADFSDGKILSSVFKGTGNDSIDVSGGTVSISGCKITNAGDKGISAGENSHLDVRESQVFGAYIGLASKDTSTLRAAQTSLHGCKSYFAAYQKKPEFGPGNLVLVDISTGPDKKAYVLEEGSSAKVDGVPLPTNIEGALGHLYDEEGNQRL